MLKVISDLTLVQRITREYESDITASGVAGTWVTLSSSNKFTFTDASTPVGLSYVVWAESNRDGTVGFSPDVAASSKISVLFGLHRAVTDQVNSSDYASFTVGAPLVAKAGVLAAMSAGEEHAVVAYVAQILGTVTHLGTSFTNCIEYWSAK